MQCLCLSPTQRLDIDGKLSQTSIIPHGVRNGFGEAFDKYVLRLFASTFYFIQTTFLIFR